MRALVADSDPDRLRQLETWLVQWGYEVWPARNGVEAWNRLSSEKTPIVAILAWQMDAMHGIDVCRRIRLQPELPTAYVLLVAENRGSEALLEGLNAGADDFLFAPLDAVEARARIRTARIAAPDRDAARRAVRDRWGIGGPFVLHVGALEPRDGGSAVEPRFLGGPQDPAVLAGSRARRIGGA